MVWCPLGRFLCLANFSRNRIGRNREMSDQSLNIRLIFFDQRIFESFVNRAGTRRDAQRRWRRLARTPINSALRQQPAKFSV